MKKITIEDISDYMNINGGGDKLLSSEYTCNSETNLEILCHSCQETYLACWAGLRLGSRCKKCSLKKLWDKSRNSKEDVINNINAHGLFVLEDFDYKNMGTKIHIQDEEGYRYFISYSAIYASFKRRKGLGKFDKSNIYTLYNITTWMKKVGYLSELIGGEYINEKENTLEFICPKGHKFISSLIKIRACKENGCSICAGRTVIFENSFGGKFPEFIEEWSDKNKFSPYDITYGNARIKVFWKCKKGHKDYLCTVANRKDGKGCPSCGKKVTDENNLLLSNHSVLSEWDHEKNGSPSNYALYSGKKVWWICGVCGSNYQSIISNRTRNGTGCPGCSATGGESVIERFLINNNIEYDFQARFPNCRNINMLPFDFYLPEYNLCIEYHGIQHYESVKFFGGQKEFLERQKLDKIKENYCKNNQINLLIIPYWNFKKIDEIMKEVLL